MSAKEIELWIMDNYPGLIVRNAYRERSLFFNPDLSLKLGLYFATIKEHDGPNDKASDLSRAGVYRLSIGVGKNQYRLLFGDVPKRPGKGGVVDLDVDFTMLDILMPHPVYAWLGWVCVLNPTKHSETLLRHLLDGAYQNILIKFADRK